MTVSGLNPNRIVDANAIDRFLAKIDFHDGEADCWLWNAGRFSDGYGQFQLRGMPRRAHRLAYEWYIDDIPKGKLVCHSCDQPLCCRPTHLFLGDPADNSRDMRMKGRQARGERNAYSRLTAPTVREIRSRHAAGETQVAMGVEYGVTQSAISAVVRRKTWRHV